MPWTLYTFYVCVLICTYMSMHIYMRKHIYGALAYVCVEASTYMCVRTHKLALHTCTIIYICMCMCEYLFIYLNSYYLLSGYYIRYTEPVLHNTRLMFLILIFQSTYEVGTIITSIF